LSKNLDTTKIIWSTFRVPPHFHPRTSSSLSPPPSSTRKRKVGHSDSVRSKGFGKVYLERNVRRVHKPDGTMWVTGTHHIIFSIGFALQRLGYRMINTVV
jgi:hypothetical protein